jgi:autotransporter-associated beta strand protein
VLASLWVFDTFCSNLEEITSQTAYAKNLNKMKTITSLSTVATRISRTLLCGAFFAVTFFAGSSAQAQTDTWTGGVSTSSPASGTWDNTADGNWTTSPWGAGDIALFAGTGTVGITVNDSISANALQFTSTAGNYTLTGTTQTITLTGSNTGASGGSIQINFGVTATIGSGLTVTEFSSDHLDINGGGTLVIASGGTVNQVPGDNLASSIDGGTTVQVLTGGTLGGATIDSTALGQRSASGNNTLIVNGGTVNAGTVAFYVGANVNTGTNILTIENSGTVNSNTGKGLVEFNGGNSASGFLGEINLGNGTGSGTLSVGLGGVATSISGTSNFLFEGGTLASTASGTLINLNASHPADFNTYVGGSNSVGGAVISVGGGVTSTISEALQSGGSAAGQIAETLAAGNGNTTAGGIDGGLVSSGSGTLILTVANSYNGGTTVSAGTLETTVAGALGASTGNLTTSTGAILDLEGTTQNVGALNGSGGTIENLFNSSANSLSTISKLVVGNGGASGSYGGTILDGGPTLPNGSTVLVKTGIGTQALSGNNAFAGGTTITGGIVQVSSDNNLGNTTGVDGVTGAYALTVGFAPEVTLGGGELLASQTMTMQGSYNNNAPSGVAVALTTGPDTLAAATGQTLTVQGTIIDGPVAGQPLTIGDGTNPGTVKLTGNNTYTGGTTVIGGTLRVDNATGSGTGSGAVFVNAGTLGGGAGEDNGGTLNAVTAGARLGVYAPNGTIAGNISGPVTIASGAILAPGNSVGTLSVGSLTLATGSILDYEFSATANDFTYTGAQWWRIQPLSGWHDESVRHCWPVQSDRLHGGFYYSHWLYQQPVRLEPAIWFQLRLHQRCQRWDDPTRHYRRRHSGTLHVDDDVWRSRCAAGLPAPPFESDLS